MLNLVLAILKNSVNSNSNYGGKEKVNGTYGQIELRLNNNIISSRNMAELEGKSRLIFIYYLRILLLFLPLVNIFRVIIFQKAQS